MLSGAARPELGEHRVMQVSFKHSEVAPFDDLRILAARDEEEGHSLELQVAVRRHPKFVPSDPSSRQLIGALAEGSEALKCPAGSGGGWCATPGGATSREKWP